MKPRRFTLEMKQDVLDEIDRLAKIVCVKDRAELISRALALYGLVAENINPDGEVTITSSTGNSLKTTI